MVNYKNRGKADYKYMLWKKGGFYACFLRYRIWVWKMKYMKQFGIVLVITLVAEFMEKWIPLPVPASMRPSESGRGERLRGFFNWNYAVNVYPCGGRLDGFLSWIGRHFIADYCNSGGYDSGGDGSDREMCAGDNKEKGETGEPVGSWFDAVILWNGA